MGGSKQTLSKFDERDELLAKLEFALSEAIREAAEAMNRTRVEIERSKELMDGFVHPMASRLSHHGAKPEQ